MGVAEVRSGADLQLWSRVQQELLSKPSLSYEEITKSLERDPKFRAKYPDFDVSEIDRLIGRFEAKQETWAARDRALAEKLAERIDALPPNTPLATIARLVGDVLPGLRDHDLKRLIRRHQDILGHVSARSMAKPVPPPIRARIAELAYEHPTLEYSALAKIFAGDPKLKGALPWSPEQLQKLRESKILPSDRKRDEQLGKLATEYLMKVKKGTTIEDAVASLAGKYPGVSLEQLHKLARFDNDLADAIRRVMQLGGAAGRTASIPAPEKVVLTADQAKQLDLSAPMIERGIKTSDEGLVSQIYGMLVKLEATHGNKDGALAPRDYELASALEKAIIDGVWQVTGRRRVNLEAEVQPILPKVIGNVARKGHDGKNSVLKELHRNAVQETIQNLADGYFQEVISGGKSPTAYHASRGIVHANWARIRKVLPDLFPETSVLGLEGARLDGIAALYRELLDGTITTGAFYKRSGINVDELRILQATDPERFPRQEGAASWKTVTGRRNVELTETQIKALSKAYKSELVTGKVTRKEFEREQGISHQRLSQLQQTRPELFPPIGRWDRDYTHEEIAEAVGAAAMKLFEADVLIKATDIIKGLNADSELVERFGKFNMSRYEAIRTRGKNSDLFPPLRDIDVILNVLAQEVRELLAENMELTPRQITSAMQKAHPSFKLSRIYQLREKFGDLIPQVNTPKYGSDLRRKDAERLAAEMKKHPNRSIVDIAAEWSQKTPRMQKDYLHRLRKDFAAELFAAGEIKRESRTMERSSLPFAEMLGLAMKLSPPGVSEGVLLKVLNGLLEERGMPTYEGEKLPSNLMAKAALRYGTREEHNALTTSLVVAEYARAAKKGASMEDILAAVRRDYPTIDKFKMSSYVNMWAKNPKDYPAISSFVSRGQVQIFGKGEKVADPRFLGGWSMEKAWLGPAQKDPLIAAELARFSQFARVSMTLPMLDEMVAELNGKKPLAHTNILWVTHLLGTSFPLANALHAAGAKMASTIVVGTPYGTNEAVKQTFEEAGYDVRKPALSEADYRKTVEKAVDDMVKRHRKNHEPVVVLDDGGLVTEILHSNPAYKDVLGAFKIVEQTTRGITAAEGMDVRTPIVNVARSMTKALEGEMIGRSVAAKMLQGLKRLGKDLKGTPVTVTGYGVVGRAIAAALKKEGAIVTIVEPSSARAAEAEGPPHYFKVKPKSEAFKTAEIAIGATGECSMKLEDLALLPKGAIIASASSKQLEIDMKGLAGASPIREVLENDNPLVTLPSAKYRLKGKEITVLGDGWPLNFDGDIEDLPANEIQVTRAVMFAGALQAASLKSHHVEKQRIIPLDPDVDRDLHDRYRAIEKKRKGVQDPIGDPARWPDVIRGIAARIEAALSAQLSAA